LNWPLVGLTDCVACRWAPRGHKTNSNFIQFNNVERDAAGSIWIWERGRDRRLEQMYTAELYNFTLHRVLGW
jgi:hypothetical protein